MVTDEEQILTLLRTSSRGRSATGLARDLGWVRVGEGPERMRADANRAYRSLQALEVRRRVQRVATASDVRWKRC